MSRINKLQYYSLLLLLLCGNLVKAEEIDPPKVKYLSVTEEGHVIVEWEKSSTVEVTDYVITRDKESVHGSLEAIDTLSENEIPVYTDITANAGLNSRKYAIDAINSLNGNSRLSDIHATMFLETDYDSCSVNVSLNWSNYKGWDNIDEYQVWYKRSNESAYTQLFVSSSLDTVYQTNRLEKDTEYIFHIVAINGENGLESSSNYVTVFAGAAEVPDNMNATKTEVIGDSEFKMAFLWSSNSELKNYYLLRSENADVFDTIKRLTNYQIHYAELNDTSAATNEKVYNYKLIGLNRCLDIVKESPLCNNILLEAESSGSTINMSWNQYLAIDENNLKYQLYRTLETKELIETTRGQSFSDDVKSTDYNNLKEVCYYILAYDETNNQLQSISNIACVPFEPKVIMPNAFNPNATIEKDRYFGPVVNMIPVEFKMEIVNRWGRTVFTSNDFNKFWEGKSDSGTDLPGGAYLYYVYLKFANGQDYKSSGSFMLIR